MKQASATLWWSLRITRKTYDTRTKSGGIKAKIYLAKTAYQSEWTMPLELIHLKSPPAVAVNFDNRKAMVKEKWHKAKFEKSQKMIA